MRRNFVYCSYMFRAYDPNSENNELCFQHEIIIFHLLIVGNFWGPCCCVIWLRQNVVHCSHIFRAYILLMRMPDNAHELRHVCMRPPCLICLGTTEATRTRVRRNSTRVEQGRKCWILVAIKMQSPYRSGEGGEQPTLYSSFCPIYYLRPSFLSLSQS